MGVFHCRVREPTLPHEERKKSPQRHLRPSTDYGQRAIQDPPGETLDAHLHQTTTRDTRILPQPHGPPRQPPRLRTARHHLHAFQPRHPLKRTPRDHQTHHRSLRRNFSLHRRRRKRILHQPLTELHKHRTNQRDTDRNLRETRTARQRVPHRSDLPL